MKKDLLWVYLRLMTIKRHLVEKNYGLMEERLNGLGLDLEEEIEPLDGLEWK